MRGIQYLTQKRQKLNTPCSIQHQALSAKFNSYVLEENELIPKSEFEENLSSQELVKHQKCEKRKIKKKSKTSKASLGCSVIEKPKTEGGNESNVKQKKRFRQNDFNLEEKIEALPSLSLEDFQLKKRARKKRNSSSSPVNTLRKTETNSYDDYELGSETKTEHYLIPVPNDHSSYRSDQLQNIEVSNQSGWLSESLITLEQFTPETGENNEQSQNKVAVLQIVDGSSQTSHQNTKPLNISSRVCDAQKCPNTINGTFNVRPTNSTNFVSTQNSYVYHEPIRQGQIIPGDSLSSSNGAYNSQKATSVSATSIVPVKYPSQHEVSASVTVPRIEKKTSDNLVGSRKRKARKHNITRLEPGSNKKDTSVVEVTVLSHLGLATLAEVAISCDRRVFST